MNHQDHTHEPESDHRPGGHRAWSRRRWWAVGLVGVTGLTLTAIGVAATPATDPIGRALTTDDRAGKKLHQPSRDDRGKNDQGKNDQGKRDQGKRDQGKRDDKNKGEKEKKPPGTPVPCDADALIAAITLANARGGATLDLATDCTYLLTADIDGAGLPAITTPITLNGSKHTTIERAAATDRFRILTINTGGDLTLNKLKITGGQTDDNGGGILVNPGGNLTTNHSTITRNITDGDGGGIANNGTTHLRHSTVERNTAAGVGGGITSVGALDVKKTRVYANTALDGAGINSEGTVRIERSAITANHAEDTSGGLLVEEGIATVTDTEVSHNSGAEVGGILANFDAQVTLRSVALVGNAARTARAGGLAMNPGATIVIEDSLVKNNTAVTDGGGLYNLVEMVLRRTKVVGNQAGNEGAGIYNEATGILTVVDSKIVRNTAAVDGGGIFNDAGGTVNLETATGTVVTENRPNNCVNVPGCAG